MATYYYSTDANGSRSVGYVDYNLTPDNPGYQTRIGIGTQITISGKAYAKNIAIKSIRMGFTWNGFGPYGDYDTGCVAFVNKSIAKATAATFSMTFRITKEIWKYIKDNTSAVGGDVDINDIWFDLCPNVATAGAADVSLDFDTYNSHIPSGTVQTDFSASSTYQIRKKINISTPASPSITGGEITDRSTPSAITQFRGAATGYSLLRFTGGWSVDTNHPDQQCSHEVKLKLEGHTKRILTADTGSGASSVVMDVASTLTDAGAYTWEYTVTDEYGNTDTETGSFTVYAYSPPVITNLLLERYAIVPDAGGESHEASDDGTHLWFTLDANVASVDGYGTNIWSAVMTYWETALGESTAVTVTSQDGWTLHGVDGYHMTFSRNETEMAGISVDDSKDYSFRLTITDRLNNSATLVFDGIVKAGAVLDVSPGGVGVGMRCTGTEGGGELFQCAYPAAFGGNVAVGADKLLKVVNVTVLSGQSISANSYHDGTVSASTVQTAIGTGWTPIGLVAIHAGGTNNVGCTATQYYIDSSGGIFVRARNFSTSASTLTMSVDVLCIRTSL